MFILKSQSQTDRIGGVARGVACILGVVDKQKDRNYF